MNDRDWNKFYQENYEAMMLREQGKQRRQYLKQKLFEVYGDSCALCKEADKDVLTLDHIKNDGADERRRISKDAYKIYAYAITQKDYSRYRILCRNCQAKEYKRNKPKTLNEKLLTN